MTDARGTVLYFGVNEWAGRALRGVAPAEGFPTGFSDGIRLALGGFYSRLRGFDAFIVQVLKYNWNNER